MLPNRRLLSDRSTHHQPILVFD